MQNIGWVALTAAGVVLFVAGSQKKYNKECADIKVEVSGVNRHIFLDEKEVERILKATGDIVGQPIASINLQLLEDRLENDTWIENAELFFDNKQVLQVMVEEREPIARIFTMGGNSYYIDSSGARLPLSDKISIRVPMFTSFPSEGRRLGRKDSLLLEEIKDLATYIQADSFWNAQVAQVDITADRTFEMVPTIGNHTVLLGKGEDIEQKFNRLYSFYKQVWTRVGMERYSAIDVQYKGQVVATRKGSASTMAFVDSAKVKEAFIDLINRNKPDTIDEHEIKVKPAVATAEKAEGKDEKAPAPNLADRVKMETDKANGAKKDDDKKSENVKNDSKNVKEAKLNDKDKVKEGEPKPKAVMQKKV